LWAGRREPPAADRGGQRWSVVAAGSHGKLPVVAAGGAEARRVGGGGGSKGRPSGSEAGVAGGAGRKRLARGPLPSGDI
jgi:hypothetical protein